MGKPMPIDFGSFLTNLGHGYFAPRVFVSLSQNMKPKVEG